jgi:hypothetical protein
MMSNYIVRQADLARLISNLEEMNDPEGDLSVTVLVDPRMTTEFGFEYEEGSVIAGMMDTLPGESTPIDWSVASVHTSEESQQWEQVGERLPGGGTFSGMDMQVQYQFIYLKTLTDRTALEPAQMEPGEPDPNDPDAPYVTPHPPIGANITVRSDWGPVRVIVAISEDASPVPADSPWATGPVADVVSAPDLAHLDRDWVGVITLRDSAFDLSTFDDSLPDHMLKRAGDHQVSVTWRYDHSRKITDENDPTPYQEHVTIRFAEPPATP